MGVFRGESCARNLEDIGNNDEPNPEEEKKKFNQISELNLLHVSGMFSMIHCTDLCWKRMNGMETQLLENKREKAPSLVEGSTVAQRILQEENFLDSAEAKR